MAKIGKRPTDDQLLEGGGAGAGISGTKWSGMPSLKSNASTVGDIKKLAADNSHLKGAAKAASDEAKGRAATRTAARAAGAAAVGEGVKSATEDKAPAKRSEEDSFKEMERALRAADEEIESSKYGKSDGMKKGGSVKGWGKARGARKAKMY